MSGRTSEVDVAFDRPVVSVRLPDLSSPRLAWQSASFGGQVVALDPGGDVVVGSNPFRDVRGRPVSLTPALRDVKPSGSLIMQSPSTLTSQAGRLRLSYTNAGKATAILTATTPAGVLIGNGSFSSLAEQGSVAFARGDGKVRSMVAGPFARLWIADSNSVSELPLEPIYGARATDRTPTFPLDDPGEFAVEGNETIWVEVRGGLARVHSNGTVDHYTDPRFRSPAGIAIASDFSVWFADRGNSSIDRITRVGVISVFPLAKGTAPDRIAFGAGGKLFYTNAKNGAIGAFDTSTGSHVEHWVAGVTAQSIVLGADGNLWFTGKGARGAVAGWLAPGGASRVFPLASGIEPVGLAAGPDGNIWFGDKQYGLRWIEPDGLVGGYPMERVGVVAFAILSDGEFFWVATEGEKPGQPTLLTRLYF